jgi:hypothetical protein
MSKTLRITLEPGARRTVCWTGLETGMGPTKHLKEKESVGPEGVLVEKAHSSDKPGPSQQGSKELDLDDLAILTNSKSLENSTEGSSSESDDSELDRTCEVPMVVSDAGEELIQGSGLPQMAPDESQAGAECLEMVLRAPATPKSMGFVASLDEFGGGAR